jgi:UDP-N-acetylmuramoylalanine--D-glutamate ligase
MIPSTNYSGATVAVFGLGGSGLAACRSLLAGQAKVIAFDDDAKRVATAAAEGITTQDLHESNWQSISALVLTPGVPLTHPKPHWTVDLARAHRKPVIGDIDLFCQYRRSQARGAPLIAITGTNGKSTTTALIAHILRAAGKDVQMGGNIGTPILALEPPADDRFHVIEVSSYQIELAPLLAPTVGVLLNLSPDHLDRHGTMEYYASIKERLVHASRIAVVNRADPWCASITNRILAWRWYVPGFKAIEFSGSHVVNWGYGVNGTEIGMSNRGQWDKIADLSDIPTLRGGHNAQNAAAAVAALDAFGLQAAFDHNTLPHFERIPFGVIQEALRSFPGLPHRLEEVGRRGNELFINDSKATNADSTAQALACFNDIFWIAGGQPKAGGISSLAPFHPRIRKAYLIGEAAADFAAELEGKVPHVIAGTMAHALKLAARDAASADVAQPVVLLSPACASFDQFRNFEVRGDAFRELVQSMPGITRSVR